MSELFTLFDDQIVALDELKAAIRAGSRRPVLQAPCGFGKTILGAHIIDGALRKGKRVAFLVNRLTLVDQSFDKFVANGIGAENIGVIQGNHQWRCPNAPVQICSIQTLAIRGYPNVDVVVADEVHERSKATDQWIKDRPEVLFIGLTATPWSKGMGDVWDALVAPVSMKDLIAKDRLVPFRIFASAHPDLTGVRTTAGDYNEADLAGVMSSKTITADIVSTWLEKGERRQTILFAVDRAHAAAVCEEFLQADVPAEYIDGLTPREEREAMFRRYRNGDTLVLCSIGVLTTGFDELCQCIILARPTKSEILFVQMIGRGLRTEKGKVDCLVFDHTDTTLKLGLPTDIGRDSLRTGASDAAEKQKAKDEGGEILPKPRECKACSFLIPPGHFGPCPSCGAEPPKRSSDVVTIEGELFEMGKDRPAKKPIGVKDVLASMGKQVIYSQLLALQGSKADGWVSNQYRQIFDVWPKGL